MWNHVDDPRKLKVEMLVWISPMNLYIAKHEYSRHILIIPSIQLGTFFVSIYFSFSASQAGWQLPKRLVTGAALLLLFANDA